MIDQVKLEQSAIACIAGLQELIAKKPSPSSPEYCELLAKIAKAKEEYDSEITKQRFAEMANRYQKELAEGTPPHLFEP